MSEYALLKLVHLGSLVFWLVLIRLDNAADYRSPVAARVSHTFFLTILLEHIAFATLLASGTYMAIHYHMTGMDWLQQKLLLIAIAIIPLEIMDVILGNWLVAQASSRLYRGRPSVPGTKPCWIFTTAVLPGPHYWSSRPQCSW